MRLGRYGDLKGGHALNLEWSQENVKKQDEANVHARHNSDGLEPVFDIVRWRPKST